MSFKYIIRVIWFVLHFFGSLIIFAFLMVVRFRYLIGSFVIADYSIYDGSVSFLTSRYNLPAFATISFLSATPTDLAEFNK